MSIRSASFVTESPAFADIDADDAGNTMACTEYIKDIHRNLRAAESSYLASASYMDKQVRDLPCATHAPRDLPSLCRSLFSPIFTITNRAAAAAAH